jgi:hypothetical protein
MSKNFIFFTYLHQWLHFLAGLTKMTAIHVNISNNYILFTGKRVYVNVNIKLMMKKDM